MSVLNKSVSYFPSITATKQGVEVNLLTLLQSDKHKEKILHLRELDVDMQKKFKLTLPCYTIAGTFYPRSDSGLIALSGLAGVDIDFAENYDAIDILHQLRKIDYISYCGLSCRGQRLFCIIPLLFPEKYKQHYDEIALAFKRIGLPVDMCHKTISQPRQVSWNDDSTQFFNHSAKPFAILSPKKTYIHVNPLPVKINLSAPENVFEWCVEQINKSYSFTEGNRNNYILHLSRYCNIKGLSEDETLNGCLQFILEDFSKIEIKNIVRNIYLKHADSHASLPFTEKAITSDFCSFKPPDKQKVQTDVIKPQELIKISDITEPKQPALTLIETAFTGKSGKFYVQNPVNPQKFAVYNNEEAYNTRQHIPTYIERIEAELDFQRITPINPTTLLTNKF